MLVPALPEGWAETACVRERTWREMRRHMQTAITTGTDCLVILALQLVRRETGKVHGSDVSGVVIFRKTLRRDQLLKFFASRP
ncbi:hypothetical protein AAV28_38825 [Bradyrhizobium diazoefficiens USDA 110]|uniref:Transposase n=1 Tax=Bradyrhizobium japonicum TaxID=375 RepID=A0A0M9B4S2_BRAJP|nr:hypothetical protein RN69_42715 [Bradyrhizobium japonicum]AND93048.1 hypothetical protein AAV28_38825 [Bradyrhizobium diazoefficiens USDA 110]APO57021.1 hypothetical protein BD122_42040 [Bradyrhizobium diazoefficiens]APG15926.1 hypothetical protein BKD09_47360 [Bradyrhizobium japonicum]KMJ93292.1 hypothetical protein CF64_43935 [Bradyrhizobium japonicum]